MQIEVLGPGCPKCKKTAELLKEILTELDIDARIKKITDINEMAEKGVMMTPAVIIDGEVKLEGRVPGRKDIRSWLAEETG